MPFWLSADIFITKAALKRKTYPADERNLGLKIVEECLQQRELQSRIFLKLNFPQAFVMILLVLRI